LQYVRNSSALAPNDISVVVVASAIWNNNGFVILLTCAESDNAVTTSRIPTKLNDNVFTLSCYFMLLLSIIIVMIIIIMYYYHYQINQLGVSCGGIIITCVL
jgi:hypothetical protein